MFERFRKAFALGIRPDDPPRPVSLEETEQWAAAQGLAFSRTAEPGGFLLLGQYEGHTWRLECGAPQRHYLRGTELRARIDVGVRPDLALMLVSRPLKEALEGEAYGAFTDTLQTSLTGDLPEEVRWLAVFEEMAWPGVPLAFWQHFAVVGEGGGHAKRWVQETMISHLLEMLLPSQGEPEASGVRPPKAPPLMLMVARGKVSLRMQYPGDHLHALADAVMLLHEAARSAMQHLPHGAADEG
ncbi:hypothetical protein [Acidovorax sp. SUPP3334]|uniref:hypothetical protein n=1 Tax=Acidovorax sp. SUPP3334 TaxID=2920881 RepID=UPI0023DE5615|nr:hypothetical protein [Acidovorax sp. SUPP3334]GKT20649.1 hypothetical protein AVHM3334_01860 [Acidovorax sp. SUPP3334]